MTVKTLQAVINRDRIIIALGITVIALCAWAYLVLLAIAPAQVMVMPMHYTSGWHTLGLNFIMWSAMMVAMMLPSASPMIMCFSRVQQQKSDSHWLSGVLFVSGYLILWIVFSAVAATCQLFLHNTGLLSAPMGKTGPLLAGGLLISAGAFQWSPLKEACLGKCRSPLSFLLLEWRDGIWGAFVMGFRHAIFCIGCCWALMSLMFVGGVMNLTWMALLAVFMLLEKVLTNGRQFSRFSGVVLMLAGVWLLYSHF